MNSHCSHKSVCVVVSTLANNLKRCLLTVVLFAVMVVTSTQHPSKNEIAKCMVSGCHFTAWRRTVQDGRMPLRQRHYNTLVAQSIEFPGCHFTTCRHTVQDARMPLHANDTTPLWWRSPLSFQDATSRHGATPCRMPGCHFTPTTLQHSGGAVH